MAKETAGPENPRDSFGETLWGFQARSAWETPVRGRRGPERKQKINEYSGRKCYIIGNIMHVILSVVVQGRL